MFVEFQSRIISNRVPRTNVILMSCLLMVDKLAKGWKEATLKTGNDLHILKLLRNSSLDDLVKRLLQFPKFRLTLNA